MMHAVVKLDPAADSARLQRFLEQCSDYYELHEGWPTPPDAAEHELTGVPPTSTLDDLSMLALEDEHGALVAAAQLLRNYPECGTWWIGMLLVLPALRGRGLGSLLLRHVSEAAAAGGVRFLRLVVSLDNPRAQSFWEAAGFVPTGQTLPVTARSGHAGTVRILSKTIA